ncbi:meteorin isoform X2 [Pseudophryne corroboree]|uniref:meteorin isoform X2 n=1 Tax=Pseudophryne corroboree TaxID=495146 RepID=UPI003081C869
MLLLSLWMLFLGTLHSITCSSPENQCNWRGSGLSLEPKSVEQVSLQCAEGTVEWLYPTGAIRLSLVPRQSLASPGPLPSRFTACIKPAASFRGAQLYLEKEGVLELLLSEGAPAMLSRVHCFSWQPHQKVALFLQATPQLDISRRISAFRYELRGDWDGRLALPLTKMSIEGACSPCNDTEILMAVCTSDFGKTLFNVLIKTKCTKLWKEIKWREREKLPTNQLLTVTTQPVTWQYHKRAAFFISWRRPQMILFRIMQ